MAPEVTNNNSINTVEAAIVLVRAPESAISNDGHVVVIRVERS